jgi:hypothetical protein
MCGGKLGTSPRQLTVFTDVPRNPEGTIHNNDFIEYICFVFENVWKKYNWIE